MILLVEKSPLGNCVRLFDQILRYSERAATLSFFFLYLSRKYAPKNAEMRARSHSKNGGIF